MAADEDHMREGILRRVKGLFEEGYRAEAVEAAMVIVTNPQGVSYTINILERTCSCPFFVKHRGKYICKHLFGYVSLLVQQQAYDKLTITPCKQYFAVWDEYGELIVVTVYKIGAESVRKRLSVLALC